MKNTANSEKKTRIVASIVLAVIYIALFIEYELCGLMKWANDKYDLGSYRVLSDFDIRDYWQRGYNIFFYKNVGIACGVGILFVGSIVFYYIIKKWRKAVLITALIYTVAILFLCIFNSIGAWNNFFHQRELSEFRCMLRNEMQYIVHAGGHIEDDNGDIYSYTNCLEALENSYDRGNRLCEIDFTFTSDNHLVCSHEYIGTPFYKKYVPTINEYNEALVYDKFNTMTVEELASFMFEHRDLYIVTDCKNDNLGVCQQISDLYPDLLSQFIVQIYEIQEYEPIKCMGYDKIIYTLYRTSKQNKAPEILLENAQMYDLVAFTFPNSNGEYYYEALSDAGPLLCVHTVNEKTEMKKWFKTGIDLIYTDIPDSDLRVVRDSGNYKKPHIYSITASSDNHKIYYDVEIKGSNFDNEASKILFNNRISSYSECVEPSSLKTHLPLSEMLMNGNEIEVRVVQYSGEYPSSKRSNTVCLPKQGDFDSLSDEDKMVYYLDRLIDKDYMVLLSVKDESSNALTDRIVNAMEKLGLEEDLRENGLWQSYIAIIDGGQVVHEEIGDDILKYSGDFNGHKVNIISANVNVGNISSILIDNCEYSVNKTGLNIVVFDKKREEVVDSLAFQTWKGLFIQK